MPAWFPEGDVPQPGDNPLRSLQKIVAHGLGALVPDNARVTDDGSVRVTDDGGTRVVDV